MRRERLTAALCLSLAACGESTTRTPDTRDAHDGGAEAIALPWPALPVPTPAASTEPAAVLAARAELGRLLFYDPVLSVDRETACASCHSEIWGMGDGLPRSIGHGGGLLSGPGRSGGPELRRNAPQLWNLTFRKSLFWDGRSTSLEEQALAPLLAKDELNRTPEAVVAELATIEGYVQHFAAAFPDDPTPSVQHLASALATFERGLVSARSLYDGYLAGDSYALSAPMIEGMFLFSDMGCADCHVPPLFESEAFVDRKRPHTPGLDDEGRFEVTGETAERRAFRVPSLRNIAFSDPYFHDGSSATLEDAITHELEQSGRAFGADDVELIKRFISDALKDESREPDRPDSVPSGLRVPIDGTFVERF